MKKKTILTLLTAVLSFGMTARAWEVPGFEWSIGADVTTNYLWRGMNYGGLSFQPDASIGYGGLTAEVWANLSPEDYTFRTFAPEMDVTIAYSVYGFKVGVTHQYYFDGTPYFDYSRPSVQQYEDYDYSTNQTEVFAEFNLGDVVENAPLHLGWYTFVGGDDWYMDENGEIKRAWSSYFEASYDISLPLNFTLTPTIGFTPWKSLYNYYEGGFSLNNLSVKANWELEVGDHFCLDLYGLVMLNASGINRDNAWPALSDAYNNQRFNIAIGLGIWFF